MRIRARAFLPSALLMSLLAGPLVPELSAGIVTVSYGGTIMSVSAAATAATKVVVGDTITGSFSYDSSEVASSAGDYPFTGSSKVHTMSFKIFNSSDEQV